jgi:hypothetical protein
MLVVGRVVVVVHCLLFVCDTHTHTHSIAIRDYCTNFSERFKQSASASSVSTSGSTSSTAEYTAIGRRGARGRGRRRVEPYSPDEPKMTFRASAMAILARERKPLTAKELIRIGLEEGGVIFSSAIELCHPMSATNTRCCVHAQQVSSNQWAKRQPQRWPVYYQPKSKPNPIAHRSPRSARVPLHCANGMHKAMVRPTTTM